VINDWVNNTPWVEFLARDPATRSNTSVCLSIVDPAVTGLSDDAKAAFCKALVARLDKAGVAYDIGAYKDAPPGLRIWCGSTVETANLEHLTPWLDFAFESEKAALAKVAA
jgi:phosphoserine aminotransferase